MMLSGTVAAPSTYSVMVVATGTNSVSASNLNQTSVVKVTHILSGNSCWGNILVQDKSAPVITCSAAPLQTVCAATDLGISVNEKILFNNNPANGVNVDLTIFGTPVITENCGKYTVYYSDMITDYDCATTAVNGFSAQIMRTYRAIDAQGNQSICTITINLTKPAISAVVFPADKVIGCDDTFAKDANNNPAPSVSGSPNINSVAIYPTMAGYCEFNATYQDSIYTGCGNGYKVRRAWTVLDWCTNQVKKVYQIIEIKDLKAPKFISCPTTTWELFTSSSSCKLDSVYLPKPAVTDNCDANPVVTAKILDSNNKVVANGMAIKDLLIGDYTIVYTVTDACGNNEICMRPMTIRDNVAPIAICRQNTVISLTLDGTGRINAKDIDEGSKDNCCIDLNSFHIKRVSEPDSLYRSAVNFNCSDINVMVALRVSDCYQNTNFCMVNITVQDKLPPVIFAKDNMMVCSNNADATAWLNANQPQKKDLTSYPSNSNAGYYDNCDASTIFIDNAKIDNCGNGNVTRTWTVTDANGAKSSTTQTVMSINMSAYEVTFPEDKELTCNASQSYNTLPTTTGEPVIKAKGNSCPLVGVEYTDEIFDVVPGACFKILRKWKVINWCQNTNIQNLDGDLGKPCSAPRTYSNVDANTVSISNSTSIDPMFKFKTIAQGVVASVCPGYDDDGYMEFTQIIKVTDNVAPVIVNIPKIDIQAKGKDCVSTITAFGVDATDCTKVTDSRVTIYKKSTTGAEIFVDEYSFTSKNDKKSWDINLNQDAGKYVARYRVTDKCGNYTTSDQEFVVKDVKKPSPVCFSTLAVELMQSGMVMVNAKIFNNGSYDNCTADQKLKFRLQVPAPTPGTSFDPTLADSMYTFACPTATVVPSANNSINYSYALWVGDEAGNWDFCSGYVNVQDNMFACKYIPIQMKTVTGTIATEFGTPAKDLKVSLKGVKNMETTTDANGQYTFKDLPINEQYSITPELDNDPLNGVSTYDLVLISKNILNTQPLKSAYKIIAADVNNSKTVTTADMVELRKLILHLNNNFTNNVSWKFVDKSIVFGANPLQTSINNGLYLTNTNATLDFVAVKIGDVNTSAANVRGANGTLELQTNEQSFISGQEVSIPVTSANIAGIEGYQFTFKYDTNTFDFVRIDGGSENFNANNDGYILASWNGKASNNETLFTVVLRAKEASNLSKTIALTSSIIKAEAYDNNADLMNINFKIKGAKAGEAFELFQNEPNPFNGNTTIRFVLPEAASATISILDATGRVYQKIENNYERGMNEIKIDRQDLPNSGIFFYRLETATHTATKKMLVIKN